MERAYSLRKRPSAAPEPISISASNHSSQRKNSGRSIKKSKRKPLPETLPSGLCVSANVGARPHMEDAFGHHITSKAVVLGVFDGHGGDECSNFCAERLCEEVAKNEQLESEPLKSLHDVFTRLDKEFADIFVNSEAGSTATVAVLQRTEKDNVHKLSVGFVGDSSALLIRADGTHELLTSNHHGSREDERERIQKLGGSVVFDSVDKVFRVGGVLAVTRALGDTYLKPFVSSVPESKEVNVAEGDILIIGSDGLWDEIRPENIAKTIKTSGLIAGVKQIVDEAAQKGDDNVCAIALDVGDAVKHHLTAGGQVEVSKGEAATGEAAKTSQ